MGSVASLFQYSCEACGHLNSSENQKCLNCNKKRKFINQSENKAG